MMCGPPAQRAPARFRACAPNAAAAAPAAADICVLPRGGQSGGEDHQGALPASQRHQPRLRCAETPHLASHARMHAGMHVQLSLAAHAHAPGAAQVVAERMKNEGVSRAIMVIASNLTPFAKQCLLDLMPKLHIEQFTENELLVNITGGWRRRPARYRMLQHTPASRFVPFVRPLLPRAPLHIVPGTRALRLMGGRALRACRARAGAGAPHPIARGEAGAAGPVQGQGHAATADTGGRSAEQQGARAPPLRASVAGAGRLRRRRPWCPRVLA